MKTFRFIAAAALAASCLSGGLAGAAHAESVLQVALSTSLNSLDPNVTTLGEEYVLNGLVFSGLTRIDADSKVQPDLAVSWSSSADLREWTFKLRPGVKFHHGKPLQASDAVFTFQRIMDPATGSAGRTQLEVVKSVDAPDDATVHFKLSQPYADFPGLLTGRQLRIVAKDRADTIKTQPSGTGPFRFIRYTPGDQLEVERNPDYYDKDRIKIDRVVLRIMPEAASRVAALRSGGIDLIWNLPLEIIPDLKKDSNVVVESVPSASWDGIILNNAKPPFNDVRVRRAVYLALDKKALVEFALFGEGKPTHTPISPDDPAFNKDIGFTPDLAQAKKLLAEAGYPQGFPVDIFVPAGRPARERLGVAAQQLLRPLGIKLNVQRLPYNRYSAEVAGIAPMYVDGFFANPVIDASTSPWFYSTGSWNARMWHFKSQAADQALDAARAATDPAERIRQYQLFQKIVTDEVPGVIAYVSNVATAYRAEVKGYHTNPFLWLDLYDVQKTAGAH
ncbi:ABC transporter substrate-binding protein [Bordetella sp. N]|uniref:ABC transporter substrate-binding protein n=1 Tax=Bordetella sp. N TaxID=1746199 RepID=UPI00070C3718|nr:ABC transporter substrate-binding protein [Bordetella sp. N]ALM84083.1 ABC transporter substrate-binding protein [Bordetella sp. N]